MLLSWLVDAGGIAPEAGPDGDYRWHTTAAGRDAARMGNPAGRLTRFLGENPDHRGIYLDMLRACLSPKSRVEIESLLRGQPIIESGKVLASFFIEGLERAGGLEWDRHWQTTEAGRRAIA